RPDVEAAAVAGEAPGGADASAIGAIEAVSRALPGWRLGVESCGGGAGVGNGTGGGNPELAPETPTPHLYECQRQAPSGERERVIELATRNLERGAVALARAGLDASGPFVV